MTYSIHHSSSSLYIFIRENLCESVVNRYTLNDLQHPSPLIQPFLLFNIFHFKIQPGQPEQRFWGIALAVYGEIHF